MSSTSGAWAVVTGASSGIGKATAMTLARAGWNVVVHYHQSRESAEELADAIRSLDRAAALVAGDLGAPGGPETIVERAWFATGGVDAWIQNAGADVLTGENARLPFEDKLDLLTRVDLWGTVLTCRAAGRRMRERARGTIVTIGWDQASTGMEGDSGELFTAIKGGIAAFTRSLAKTLAPRVRVNCVAPGWIQTAWGRQASEHWQNRAASEALLRRWGKPDDVAAAIEYLVSDRASFITGQTLHVNGGVVVT